MPNVTHRFVCTECGKEGIPIVRQTNKLREQGHWKRLYCVFCKKICEHVECRNEYELKEFLDTFNNQ